MDQPHAQLSAALVRARADLSTIAKRVVTFGAMATTTLDIHDALARNGIAVMQGITMPDPAGKLAMLDTILMHESGANVRNAMPIGAASASWSLQPTEIEAVRDTALRLMVGVPMATFLRTGATSDDAQPVERERSAPPVDGQSAPAPRARRRKRGTDSVSATPAPTERDPDVVDIEELIKRLTPASDQGPRRIQASEATVRLILSGDPAKGFGRRIEAGRVIIGLPDGREADVGPVPEGYVEAFQVDKESIGSSESEEPASFAADAQSIEPESVLPVLPSWATAARIEVVDREYVSPTPSEIVASISPDMLTDENRAELGLEPASRYVPDSDPGEGGPHGSEDEGEAAVDPSEEVDPYGYDEQDGGEPAPADADGEDDALFGTSGDAQEAQSPDPVLPPGIDGDTGLVEILGSFTDATTGAALAEWIDDWRTASGIVDADDNATIREFLVERLVERSRACRDASDVELWQVDVMTCRSMLSDADLTALRQIVKTLRQSLPRLEAA